MPPPVQQSFNYKLLAIKLPDFIHTIPAALKEMPRNGGTTMRFRRFDRLPPALQPLGNTGAPIPPTPLNATDIDAKIDFYGQWIGIVDQVSLQNQDPVLNEAAKLLGIALRETEDTLTRNMLAGTATAINAEGGSNGDNPTEISQTDTDYWTQVLLGNDARCMLDTIPGENRFGTGPVRDAFFGLSHTDMTSSLVAAGATQKAQYPNPTRPLEAEWAALGNIRFCISSIGSITPFDSAQGANVYNNFIVAMEAYAIIKQDGAFAQFLYKPAQFSDALMQTVSCGWRTAMVPRILNDQWLLNGRCTLPA